MPVSTRAMLGQGNQEGCRMQKSMVRVKGAKWKEGKREYCTL